jgi:hypothetical protein
MMVGETGSTELGGSKAQWIAQMFSTIASSYPRVHAVVWFDRVKETDWTIGSSSSALAAWQKAAAAPADAGTATTLEAEGPFGSAVTSAPGTEAPAATIETTGSSSAHATPTASRSTTPIASRAHLRLADRAGSNNRARVERSHRRRARHRPARRRRHAASRRRAVHRER